MFYYLNKVVDKTNHEVRRLANRAMAPVLSNLAEAVTARELARVMGRSEFFVARHEESADRFNSANFTQATLMTWYGATTTFFAVLVSLSASCFVLFTFVNADDAAEAGLALTYASLMPYFVQTMCMVFMFLKMTFTSLERMLEFLDVPQEAPFSKSTDETIPQSWPARGAIDFKNLHLRYGPTLDPVLKGINVSIAGGTKVGTVVPQYAQGCDLSWTYSNVIVHDRPQPWAYGYFLFPYHTFVYVRYSRFTRVFFHTNTVKYWKCCPNFSEQPIG